MRLLGAGGMGEVYEAVHAFTGHRVALKILQLRHASKSDILERMRREARFLGQVRHPNMVAVHDADITADGLVWIAMELLEGKPLREVMGDGGPMPLRAALFLGHHIADGLQAAHDHGVVHRDIKPENVFVTTGHAVKVLDLGAAKFHGWEFKTTDRMRTLGTPAYMSPEHLEGHTVDGRADQYALGLVLYEMIAGRHPFVTSRESPPSAQELATLQIVARPRPLPEIVSSCPAYVDAIIAKALSKDREARYASMSALSGALQAAARRLAEERGEAPDAVDPTLLVRPASQAPAAAVAMAAERRSAPGADRGGAAALAPTEMVVTTGASAGATLVNVEPAATTAKGTLIQRGASPVVTAGGTHVQLDRPDDRATTPLGVPSPVLAARSPTLAAASPAPLTVPSPTPRAPRDPRTQKLPAPDEAAPAVAGPRDPRTQKLPPAAAELAVPGPGPSTRAIGSPVRAALAAGLAIGLGVAVVAVIARSGRTIAPADVATASAIAAVAPPSATPPGSAVATPPSSAAPLAAPATAGATALPAPTAVPAPPSVSTTAAPAAGVPARRPSVGLPSSGL